MAAVFHFKKNHQRKQDLVDSWASLLFCCVCSNSHDTILHLSPTFDGALYANDSLCCTLYNRQESSCTLRELFVAIKHESVRSEKNFASLRKSVGHGRCLSFARFPQQ